MACKLWSILVDSDAILRKQVAQFRFPNHEMGLDTLPSGSVERDLIAKLGFQPAHEEAARVASHTSAGIYAIACGLQESATFIFGADGLVHTDERNIPHFGSLVQALIITPSTKSHTVRIRYTTSNWDNYEKTWMVPRWHQYLWIPVDVRLQACVTVRILTDARYHIVYTSFHNDHETGSHKNEWISSQEKWRVTVY